jgi:hypothetical protein
MQSRNPRLYQGFNAPLHLNVELTDAIVAA